MNIDLSRGNEKTPYCWDIQTDEIKLMAHLIGCQDYAITALGRAFSLIPDKRKNYPFILQLHKHSAR
jgi:hypothetical protein